MPQPDETLDAPAYEPPKPQTTRLAVASLIMAVASWAVFLFAHLCDALWPQVRPKTSGAIDFLSLATTPLLLMSAVALALGIAGIIRVAMSCGRFSGRLLATIAVLLVIAMGFLAPIVASPRREGSLRPGQQCKQNLLRIGLACFIYADDNSGSFPPDLAALYPACVDNAKVFSCPTNPSKYREFAQTGRFTRESTSYVYVSGLKRGDPGDCVLAFDRPENHQGHQGRNVVFADTHIVWINKPPAGGPDEFKALLEKTREAVKKRGGEIRLVGE
jgi:hypothetical protein